MQINKIGLGIIGEKFTNCVVHSVFKAKDDFKVKHVDWDKYNTEMGHGLDLRIFQRNKQVMAVEVKNWRDLEKPYGTSIVESEIIDRFHNFAGGLKVLIITFLSLLTQRAIRLLESHNIHVIEVGKLMGKNDFPRRGKDNSIFYSLKSKLSKLWSSCRGFLFIKGSNSFKLTKYMTTIDIPITNTNTLITTNEHDTELNKSNTNYAFNLVIKVLNRVNLPKEQRFKPL